MGKAIPTQHPAVVLRAHYSQLRALLATAMIAVVGLTAAVVILATNDDGAETTSSAVAPSGSAQVGSIRYDGGPEEGTRVVVAARQPAVRYDGGPEEGTAALAQPVKSSPGVRYDGGPEEGSRGAGR